MLKTIFNFTTNKMEINALINRIKSRNKSIVFTNGCFDILHAGHVYLLNESKKLGDVLIVGINSDKSIKLLKGNDRPFNNENDRIYILSNLKAVNYAIIFDEYSVLELIKFIVPDIITKSSEYSIEDLETVGGKFMREIGNDVILIPHREGRSTSELIKKLKHENS